MKILITGTAGRVGRAIYVKLMQKHSVIGIDRSPCSTADYVGDIRDKEFIRSRLSDVEVIVHTAALHAPHVGLFSEKEFEDVNVNATENLMTEGIKHGIKHFVFTSTTALYGNASTPEGKTGWINEKIIPQPKSIYHRTKISAEKCLQQLSFKYSVPVTVLQMSRCFPEPADLMAWYRLNRGVDSRDVADAHLLAIEKRLDGFRRYIISGNTPFKQSQRHDLYNDAAALIERIVPKLASEFKYRGWNLPSRIDRVYDSSLAQKELEWNSKFGYESVLEMLDNNMSEVLPVVRHS